MTLDIQKVKPQMRYPKEHKEETRRRILEAAGRLFRLRGSEAVSVDELMSEAGLTRGGFYAHFESKEQLLVEIMRSNTGLVRMLEERQGETSQLRSAEALEVLSEYLDPANREQIAEGCPLATMPVDVARGGGELRDAYSSRFRQLVRELQRGLGRGTESEDRAMLAAVLAVGGVVFSRTLGDARLAARLERACLRHIETLLDPEAG